MASVVTVYRTYRERLEATPQESLRAGDEVLFLVDSEDSDSITMSAGRRGVVAAAASSDLPVLFREAGDYYGMSGHVKHVAKIMPGTYNTGYRAHVGDSVLLVTSRHAGLEAIVENASDAAFLTVRPTGTTYSPSSLRVSKWIPMLEESERAAWVDEPAPRSLESLEPEEIPELPAYWQDRLVSFAKIAKRKHGWCSEIDKLTRQILEPALPKFTVEPHPLIGGFSVIDPKTTDMVAWFNTEAEATLDAKARSKKLVTSL